MLYYKPTTNDVLISEQFAFANSMLTTSVSGTYDDTNALANITIAGWTNNGSHAGCSGVDVFADGKSVESKSVKITNANGTVYVTGLEGVARAFGGDLSISFK